MARWTRDEVLNQPVDFVQFMMEDYLTKNGFKKKTHKGEDVWQGGDGFLVMARFLRYTYENGTFHLEAWVGKYRENPIKGFVGALPKKMFKESLEELVRLLHQKLPEEGQGPGQPITIQVPDHAKYAVPSLVASIGGIVLALFIWPLGGILLGGIGITLGQRSGSSSKASIAKASVILGTIAIVIALVGMVLNLVLTTMLLMQ